MRELHVRFPGYEKLVEICKKSRNGNIARELLPYLEDTLCKTVVIEYDFEHKNSDAKTRKQYVYRVINKSVYTVSPLYPKAREWLAARTIQKFFHNSNFLEVQSPNQF